MSLSCSTVRSTSLSAKELWIDYRLLIAFSILLFINVFLDTVGKRVLPRLAVNKHLDDETRLELQMRMLQIVLGSIIAVSGLGFVIFQASTGCNANEIFVFWIAGISLVGVDTHEFVRRWPLRPALLVHHLMTFAIALAFIEYDALPPSKDRTISFGTLLFLTNIGIMWCVDFFHVVFRTCKSLSVIRNYRKVYLCLAPIRISNIVLCFLGSISAAVNRVWFGFFCLLFMSLAYAFNSYKAIIFVYCFDCERYYNSHQGKWLANGEFSKKKKEAGRRRLSSTVMQMLSSEFLECSGHNDNDPDCEEGVCCVESIDKSNDGSDSEKSELESPN